MIKGGKLFPTNKFNIPLFCFSKKPFLKILFPAAKKAARNIFLYKAI